MKKNKLIGIIFLLSVFLIGICAEMASAEPWGPPPPGGRRHRKEPKCEVKVQNDADFPIYIVLDGRNQGSVWKNSSETFKIEKWGSIKVEAEIQNETAKKWVELRPDDQKAEVTFKNDDFPAIDPKTVKY